ncbi:MAG: DUF134 domain-containing protein [Clostridia bacterium]|nr:DUF134 domain-containing protein [Clostridia bacterium]
MPRPRIRRRICGMPTYLSFAPLNNLNNGTVKILVEEYEVLRLIDYERLTQEECANIMGIARTSVQKMYDEVRYKISQILVEGKTLLIEGGNYYLCENNFHCGRRFCNRN